MLKNLFLLLLLVQIMTDAAITVRSCGIETDCLEGYSCVGNICKKCLQCDLLLRKGKLCVVDFNECGECLEGFEEITVTDFSTAIKPCKPVQKNLMFKECTNNNNCPPNNYCSKESCIKCFDCSLVNRLPPVGECAKGYNECGSCMNGFHDIAVTTDTNSKPCVMDTDVLQEKIHSIGSFYAISLATVFLFIFYSFLLIYIRKSNFCRDHIVNKSTSQDICMTQPSAPPLYELNSPRIFRDCRKIDSSHISFERETTQQSKVFQTPNAVYYEREEEGTDVAARDNQISGNNEDTLSGSLDANRSQQVEGRCHIETFTHGFVGISVTDSTTYSFPQQPNEISNENNGSTGMDLVCLDVPDAAQVDKDSVNETSNNVPQVQGTEQGEM